MQPPTATPAGTLIQWFPRTLALWGEPVLQGARPPEDNPGFSGAPLHTISESSLCEWNHLSLKPENFHPLPLKYINSSSTYFMTLFSIPLLLPTLDSCFSVIGQLQSSTCYQTYPITVYFHSISLLTFTKCKS